MKLEVSLQGNKRFRLQGGVTLAGEPVDLGKKGGEREDK